MIKYFIDWNLAYRTGLQSTDQDKIDKDKDKDKEKVGNTCIRQSTDKDKGTLWSGKYINVKSYFNAVLLSITRQRRRRLMR